MGYIHIEQKSGVAGFGGNGFCVNKIGVYVACGRTWDGVAVAHWNSGYGLVYSLIERLAVHTRRSFDQGSAYTDKISL